MLAISQTVKIQQVVHHGTYFAILRFIAVLSSQQMTIGKIYCAKLIYENYKHMKKKRLEKKKKVRTFSLLKLCELYRLQIHSHYRTQVICRFQKLKVMIMKLKFKYIVFSFLVVRLFACLLASDEAFEFVSISFQPIMCNNKL